MMLIREFDSRLAGLYTRGLIRGSSHPATGQEAVAVGTCAALRDDDYITSTHRGHGHAIAKGADPNRMMAELLGRSDGYCHGKGGSMHIADFSVGMLGANGIVGGGIGLAGGAALSSRLRGEDRVAVCFFGDGALNKGVFHEVSNMAGVWKPPAGAAVREQPVRDVGARRPDDVRSATSSAAPTRSASRARPSTAWIRSRCATAWPRRSRTAAQGGGPSFVVATCYRFDGHFSGDTMRYRSAAEGQSWRARDPLVTFRARLIAEGVLDDAGGGRPRADARNEIDAAVEFAIDSPLPDPAEAWEHVLA